MGNIYRGFPGALVAKNLPVNAGDRKERLSPGWEDPLE